MLTLYRVDYMQINISELKLSLLSVNRMYSYSVEIRQHKVFFVPYVLSVLINRIGEIQVYK